MKIDAQKRNDIVNIGSIESIESVIRKEDMGLALSFVSEKLYSDPIGSFIRELTTNAVDANIGKDEDSPVMIHIYPEDGCMYIEVKDNGVGMSPKFFRDVYMSWFASDKRKNNEKHGGWGLGSKSPLAYQKEYEVITRYDGIEYTYVVAMENDENGLPLPKATPIMDEPTDNPNGTTIRVEIKEGDTYKIHKACKKQLAYFKAVYVKNEFDYYDNDFTIIETDDYYLRNKNYPVGTEMHISLGQVAYPINWYVLGLDRIEIPVGLKFDIGDLNVSLSREEISYTKKTIELLKRRIDKVHSELSQKYAEQLKIKDLFDYIIANSDMRNNNNYPPLNIGGISIPMSNVKQDFFFTPYEGLKLNIKNVKELFSSYLATQIRGGRKYPLGMDSVRVSHYLYRNPSICYIAKSSSLNRYDTLYTEDGYVFYRKSIGIQTFKRLAIALDQVACNDKGVTIVNNNTPLYKIGASKQINKFLKYLDTYLRQKIQSFDGIAPEEWVKEFKERERAKREDTKGEINYYDVDNRRHKLRIKTINDTKAVFIIRKDKNIRYILHWYYLYQEGNKNFRKETKFLIVAPTIYNKLSKKSNVHDVTALLKVGSYKRLLAKIHMGSVFLKLIVPCRNVILYSSYYTKNYTTILTFIKGAPSKKSMYAIDNDGEKKEFVIDLLQYFSSEFESLYNEMITNTKTKVFYCLHEFLELKELVEKHPLFMFAPETIPTSVLYEYIVKNKILKFDKILIEMFNLKSLKNDKKLKILD